MGLYLFGENLCYNGFNKLEFVGNRNFKFAEKRAKELGAKRIDLMVWGHNRIAIHAYETYGMTPQMYIYEKHI